MLPSLATLSLNRCVPVGVTLTDAIKEEGTVTIPNPITVDVRGDTEACPICIMPFDHPAGGFTRTEQTIWGYLTDPFPKTEYLKELREANNKRFLIELLPGSGNQFHKVCLAKHVEHRGSVAADPISREPIDSDMRDRLLAFLADYDDPHNAPAEREHDAPHIVTRAHIDLRLAYERNVVVAADIVTQLMRNMIESDTAGHGWLRTSMKEVIDAFLLEVREGAGVDYGEDDPDDGVEGEVVAFPRRGSPEHAQWDRLIGTAYEYTMTLRTIWQTEWRRNGLYYYTQSKNARVDDMFLIFNALRNLTLTMLPYNDPYDPPILPFLNSRWIHADGVVNMPQPGHRRFDGVDWLVNLAGSQTNPYAVNAAWTAPEHVHLSVYWDAEHRRESLALNTYNQNVLTAAGLLLDAIDSFRVDRAAYNQWFEEDANVALLHRIVRAAANVAFDSEYFTDRSGLFNLRGSYANFEWDNHIGEVYETMKMIETQWRDMRESLPDSARRGPPLLFGITSILRRQISLLHALLPSMVGNAQLFDSRWSVGQVDAARPDPILIMVRATPDEDDEDYDPRHFFNRAEVRNDIANLYVEFKRIYESLSRPTNLQTRLFDSVKDVIELPSLNMSMAGVKGNHSRNATQNTIEAYLQTARRYAFKKTPLIDAVKAIEEKLEFYWEDFSNAMDMDLLLSMEAPPPSQRRRTGPAPNSRGDSVTDE